MRGLTDIDEDGGGDEPLGDAGRSRIRRVDDVAQAVAAVLDRRLIASSPRPLAVALSGGGDSVALLLASGAWAQARGRQRVALTVDHRLQPQSAA